MLPKLLIQTTEAYKTEVTQKKEIPNGMQKDYQSLKLQTSEGQYMKEAMSEASQAIEKLLR